VPRSFQVDLRGVVDLLSHHLYSSPDVYVRELVQNAVDAVTARGAVGSVIVECALGAAGPVLSVEDDGCGLTPDQVHELLSTIGSSSKRDELLGPRPDFLGRFGIGLLSCFLVSDEIRLVSLSSAGGPGVSWTGRGDGTYDLVELPAGTGRTQPGTTVWLRARPGAEGHLEPGRVRELLVSYAGLLPVRLVLRTADGDEELAGRPLPWVDRDEDGLHEVARGLLGEPALDVLPLSLPAAGLTGLAAVLPVSPSPTARQRSRVYLKRMLLSDGLEGLLPDWAFFVRVVVDADAVRPTASREGLVQDEVLDAVREGLDVALRAWLSGLARHEPLRLQRLVRVHALALKALAVHDPELLALFVPWLPMETTLGRMSLGEVAGRSGTVRYAATVDAFAQVAQVASAEGVCLVNAGYTYDEELLLRLPAVLPGVAVQRVEPADLLAVVHEVDAQDRELAQGLAVRADEVLAPLGCQVQVRAFAPVSLPCLYTAGDAARFGRAVDDARPGAGAFWGGVLDTVASTRERSGSAQLVLNLRCPVVRRLAQPGVGPVFRAAVEMLYVQALLLGRHPLRGAETRLLGTALIQVLEEGVGSG
jgi:molecular chaperone HtpG